MQSFFEMIYGWFSGLYGTDLADYLAGYNCETEAFDLPSHFPFIGLVTLGIVALFTAVYYYGINSSSFNQWYHWLIYGCAISFISLLFAGIYTMNDLNDGLLPDCLRFMFDEETGEVVNELITTSNCWMFGLANFIVSLLEFILVSFVIKWGSTSCKKTPF